MNRRQFLARGAVAAGVLTAPELLFAQPQTELGGVEGPLNLNWNENPLGPSPRAVAAASQAVAAGHRYPDALRGRLTDVLAEELDVATESIVLGNGSTEILQVVTQALASRRPTLVLAEPTFSILLRYQQPFDYRVERVPLDARHAHDLEAMGAKARGGPSLVYLCNPNNPTATLTPTEEIDECISGAGEDVFFLVDEAYCHYVEAPGFRSAIHWIEERRNVVVTRTFSKVYGLAGLRLGFGVAHPETAAWLRTFCPADNANGPALAAGVASVRDEQWLETSLDSNRRAKKETLRCLRELGLEALPSHTNFVMHRIEGPLDLYIARMRAEGIRVGRPFPPMLSYNRLTLGRPDEMKRFTEILRRFRRQGWI